MDTIKSPDWETIDKEMSNMQTQEMGFRKQKRTGLKKTYAVRIQPPDFKEDDDGNTQFLFYCTTRNFKPKSMECTKHVWKRAEGRTGPGVVRDGFDAMSGKCDFLVHSNKEGTDGAEKVVAVDILPSVTYNAKTNAPVEVQDTNYIELAINAATGEIEFLQVPIGVSKQQLQQLITELDKVEIINAGDTLGKAYHVYELQGNRLKIDPPARNAGTGRAGQIGM